MRFELHFERKVGCKKTEILTKFSPSKKYPYVKESQLKTTDMDGEKQSQGLEFGSFTRTDFNQFNIFIERVLTLRSTTWQSLTLKNFKSVQETRQCKII